MKKTNLLTMAKTAMKYFFDIDPIVTEHLFELVTNQGVLVHQELAYTLRTNVEQSCSRVHQLLHQQADHGYNAAA